jgi:hypothetical protein
METRGINTTEQIDAFKANNRGNISDAIDKELSLKSMLISCFTYGGIERDKWNFERYISPYIDKLGIELFNEVYAEQGEFFKKCEVIPNVYTDSEGLTYNSLKIKN